MTVKKRFLSWLLLLSLALGCFPMTGCSDDSQGTGGSPHTHTWGVPSDLYGYVQETPMLLQCRGCDHTAATMDAMLAHIDESHPDGEAHFTVESTAVTQDIYGYLCQGCSFTCATEAEMAAHVKAEAPLNLHTGYVENVKLSTREQTVYGYACDGCDFTTAKADDMATHMTQYGTVVDVDGNELEMGFVCGECGEIRSHQDHSHFPHEILERDEVDGYTCSGCDLTFGNDQLTEALAHQDQHMIRPEFTQIFPHKTYKEGVAIGTVTVNLYGYGCAGCDFTADNLAAVQQHLRDNPPLTNTHAGQAGVIGQESTERPLYRCRSCDFTSDGLDAMQAHIREENDKTQASHADRFPLRQESSDLHYDTLPLYPLVCTKCSEAFPYQIAHELHRREAGEGHGEATLAQETVPHSEDVLTVFVCDCGYKTLGKDFFVAHLAALGRDLSHGGYTYVPGEATVEYAALVPYDGSDLPIRSVQRCSGCDEHRLTPAE